ncbi:TPA: hypothetical protein DCX15_00475 [bacterium]|nr:hypothetical protein [bacterium]
MERSFLEESLLINNAINVCLRMFCPRDLYTPAHCKTVSLFSGHFGAFLNLSREEINLLQLAGKAHDVAKLAWSDNLLQGKKKDELGDDYSNIFHHPKRGASFLFDLLKEHTSNFKWVGLILCHHWGYSKEEKHYPPLDDIDTQRSLKEYSWDLEDPKFKLMVGIIKVADSLHAAISNRVYREDPLPKQIPEAIAEIRGKMGTVYHPEVVAALENTESQIKSLFEIDSQLHSF